MRPVALRSSVRTLVSAAVLGGALPFFAAPAFAQSPEGEAAPPPPPPPMYAPPPPPYAPPPYPYAATPYPPQPLPPNVAVAPGGHVAVTRTPEQGVDVHAQTTAGTVHAYGCDRVSVDPRTRAVYPSCGNPYAAPPGYYYGPPMPYYAPPPVYGPPGMYGPPPGVHVVGRGDGPDAIRDRKSKKPRYAPDPSRTGALIASSLVFGLGTAAAGTAYLGSLVTDGEPSTPALVAMGLFLTAPPSVPRFVVGQVGMGVLWTALRGTSFALGTMIDWEDDTYMLPMTLAFIVPLTLGIVDLATTPHREQLEPKRRHHETAGFTLHGIGPTAMPDRTGQLVPAVGALGSF